ncbi:MAG: DUF5320 domain-containing protein [Nitrososphaeria archaeon]
MGYRRKNMYYLTGVPGWIRFGYSPGWVGRSPSGLPPTPQYLISSGLFQPYQTQYPKYGPYNVPLSKEEEIKMLEEQAKVIEAQMNAVKKKLEELKKEPTAYSQLYYPFAPPQAPSIEEELASLEDYKEYLTEEMKGVEARVEELKRLREGKGAPQK